MLGIIIISIIGITIIITTQIFFFKCIGILLEEIKRNKINKNNDEQIKEIINKKLKRQGFKTNRKDG